MTSDEWPISYDDVPAVLLFGDNVEGLGASEAAVYAAGGRIGASLPIGVAVQRLEEQAAVDAVVVDVARDHGDLLDRLLDRIEAAAGAGRHNAVVAFTPELIDVVSARAWHGNVTLLCAPDEVERAAAVGMALARRRHRLHDVNSDGTLRLRQLSEEVGRIARTLATLSEGPGEPSATPLADRRRGFASLPASGGEAAAIRAIIRARRLRDQFFEPTLFADPAWDMMLDLMAARIERQPVAVSSLCIAAAVPPTTALRWIRTLTDAGLLVRINDPRDGRRVFIELSQSAADGMTSYLAAAKRSAAMVI